MAETQSYDIIFAGGGTSACVTAGRLAAMDPTLRILIIEAGGHTLDVPEHVQPARYAANKKYRDDLFWNHVGEKTEALRRAPIVPSGRCLGGGSSVNFMLYARATRSDYDDWERLGNPGWASEDLIPLSMKAETYQVQHEQVEEGCHGTSGPIKISRGGPPESFRISNQFLETMRQYDPERGFTKDMDGFGECDKYGWYHRYVNADTGRRSDVAHNYIYSQSGNKNLVVLVKHRVCRVIIEDGRAVGVEYVSEDQQSLTGVTRQRLTARASQLVVISAGAYNSPAILQRSGIGSAEFLKKWQIKQVADLPGVGENYNGKSELAPYHNVLFPPYLADKEPHLNAVYCGAESELQPHVDEWKDKGTGSMTSNGFNAGIKIRPNEKELQVLGESFKPLWESFYQKASDKPVLFVGTLDGFVYPAMDDRARRAFQIGYFTYYPCAIGYVRITGSDPYDRLDFNPRYLETEADLAMLRWGYKKTREYARRLPCYRGEYEYFHPKFPESSQAAVGERKDALVGGDIGVKDVQDLVYTEEDDKAIDDYHRESMSTAWHGLGTCAMKPREQGGVVDHRLNVYDIQGLKVADMSIAPLNVGANTYNTAIIIGEKAALIIAEDLGIKTALNV